MTTPGGAVLTKQGSVAASGLDQSLLGVEDKSAIGDANEEEKATMMQVIKNDDDDSEWSRQDDSFD